MYPSVVGHEVVGQVVRVGANVTNVKVGDTVGVGPNAWSCGDCSACKRDLEQYCVSHFVKADWSAVWTDRHQLLTSLTWSRPTTSSTKTDRDHGAAILTSCASTRGRTPFSFWCLAWTWTLLMSTCVDSSSPSLRKSHQLKWRHCSAPG